MPELIRPPTLHSIIPLIQTTRIIHPSTQTLTRTPRNIRSRNRQLRNRQSRLSVHISRSTSRRHRRSRRSRRRSGSSRDSNPRRRRIGRDFRRSSRRGRRATATAGHRQQDSNQVLRLTLFFPSPRIFLVTPTNTTHTLSGSQLRKLGFVYLRERGIAGPQHSAPPQPKAQTWK